MNEKDVNEMSVDEIAARVVNHLFETAMVYGIDHVDKAMAEVMDKQEGVAAVIANAYKNTWEKMRAELLRITVHVPPKDTPFVFSTKGAHKL